VVCEHLKPLEDALLAGGAKVTFRGQAWSEKCREWVYFDRVLDLAAIERRFGFPPCVSRHENLDPRSGTESGFECATCQDAVVGLVKGARKWPGRSAARK
jgi:hypothetical protein